MLSNILTCVGTGSVGVGVGMVINTLRARSRKRKAEEVADTPKKNQKPREKRNREENLLLRYGLQSHFDTLKKYISQEDKEHVHAFVNLQKYMRRILELGNQSEKDATKSRYWNPSGAISANATKVKLWVKTLQHIFTEKYTKLPEELDETLNYFLEYISAEQYNTLKELGS
jgi:hypothetical protein